MNSSKSGNKNGCPYFLSDIQACALPPDGIYIPWRIHVLHYCMSDEYKQCQTYKEYCIEKQPDCNPEQTIKDNDVGRRRHLRINEKRKVLLQSSDRYGITRGDFAETAMTKDFSQGGMRVILNSELPTDGSLLFIFGEDFLVPGLQGLAQLCWHRQFDENPQMVEAGLVFMDGFSQAVLALELEK